MPYVARFHVNSTPPLFTNWLYEHTRGTGSYVVPIGDNRRYSLSRPTPPVPENTLEWRAELMETLEDEDVDHQLWRGSGIVCVCRPMGSERLEIDIQCNIDEVALYLARLLSHIAEAENWPEAKTEIDRYLEEWGYKPVPPADVTPTRLSSSPDLRQAPTRGKDFIRHREVWRLIETYARKGHGPVWLLSGESPEHIRKKLKPLRASNRDTLAKIIDVGLTGDYD